ncbi:MAG: alpha-E domain-containing protein [Oscillatoriales cyanobacterium]|nr:MAG: alpha-E domain-containing protein [Oscillatoriales cyanobacterium]
MLSRVADSIYWLNRYVERAENVARFVDVNLKLSLDLPSGVSQQWEPLIMTTGDSESFQVCYGEASAENVIHFLTFDPNYSNSILSCLKAARENARSIRETLSTEVWEQINTFYLMVKEAAENYSAGGVDLDHFFNEVKMASHLFYGVTDATMTHSEGWHFGQIGRFLERADKTSRILDVKYYILLPSVQDVGTTLDRIQWIALLKSASAYEMYQRWRNNRISPTGVVEFLLLDRHFPRAVLFCLLQAQKSLHEITGTPTGTWSNPVERPLGRLLAELSYLAVDDVMDRGLHEFIDGLQLELNAIGQQMNDRFFALRSVA